MGRVAAEADRRPQAAMDALSRARNLEKIDEEADEALAHAFSVFPRNLRRRLLLNYLGFPFYDIATLALVGGEGQDEFNPVLVDRISPDDAASIREGGAEATLKGIQFNNFGAFFSRAYRENDYLWGRLHGAERMVDIVVSALPQGQTLAPGRVTAIKTQLFRNILAAERDRLKQVAPLFEQLDQEIG